MAGADRGEGEKQAWAGRTAGQCPEEERLGADIWEPSKGHQGLGHWAGWSSGARAAGVGTGAAGPALGGLVSCRPGTSCKGIVLISAVTEPLGGLFGVG